jgi:formate-dependent nitrite reductase membrane component NrfD
LVLGAYALGLHAAVSGIWLLYGIGAATGVLTASPAVWTALAVAGIPAGVLVAGYTAFLFGQAEGRDLWQSPLLFWHLIVQAVMVGSGALALAGLLAGTPAGALAPVHRTFVVATALHVLMLLLEYLGRHASKAAAAAAHMVTHGRYARLFWGGAVALSAAAAVLALTGWNGAPGPLVALAALAVQASLLVYESVFVRAGQDIPLS